VCELENKDLLMRTREKRERAKEEVMTNLELVYGSIGEQ